MSNFTPISTVNPNDESNHNSKDDSTMTKLIHTSNCNSTISVALNESNSKIESPMTKLTLKSQSSSQFNSKSKMMKVTPKLQK
jgi:hypothetical protein